jgi:hypothetical protein
MNKRLYVIIAALGVMPAAGGTESESTTTTVAEAPTTSEAEVPTTEMMARAILFSSIRSGHRRL